MRRTTWLSAGLFATWAVHDAEELITGSRTSRDLAGRAPGWLPLPADVRRSGFSRRHMTISIGVASAFMGAAALDGARSGGRSAFFQTVLHGYGWHGVGHLATAAVLRQYTSGVATAPAVVIPYWLWARRELAREEVPVHPVTPRSLLVIPPLLIGTHALAWAIARVADRAAAERASRARDGGGSRALESGAA